MAELQAVAEAQRTAEEEAATLAAAAKAAMKCDPAASVPETADEIESSGVAALAFSLHHPDLAVTPPGGPRVPARVRRVKHTDDGWSTAVMSGQPSDVMCSGIHYAEFNIVTSEDNDVVLGVARPSFDPTGACTINRPLIIMHD